MKINTLNFLSMSRNSVKYFEIIGRVGKINLVKFNLNQANVTLI